MARSSAAQALFGLLSLAVVALPTAAENACSASSPAYCFVGYSTGTNYSMVYAVPTSSYSPDSDGDACSCVSYVWADAPGQVQYSQASATTLTYLQTTPQSFTSVTTCRTNLCNCGSSCTNPFAICPVTGSSGPLQCRVGSVGSFQDEDTGLMMTMTPSTYGNLASTTAPAGSLCLSASFNNSTQYYYGSVDTCVSIAGSPSYYSGVSACKTDNCGAPAPTWPQCPTTQVATSCYVGATGPTAAVAAIGLLMGISSVPSPMSITGPAGACLSGVVTCAALVAAEVTTSTQCPIGQSLTAYLAGVADTSTADGVTTCTSWAATLSSIGAGSVVVCGSNNCNAPTTTTYLSATATLAGYTAATFGTAQATAFSAAMATSLQLTPASIIVTGVTDVTPSAAGRHLLASSVAVSFSVAATTASLATVTAALATPPTAAALQAAGLTACTAVSVSPPAATASTSAPVAAANLPSTTKASPSAVLKPTAGLMAAALYFILI